MTRREELIGRALAQVEVACDLFRDAMSDPEIEEDFTPPDHYFRQEALRSAALAVGLYRSSFSGAVPDHQFFYAHVINTAGLFERYLRTGEITDLKGNWPEGGDPVNG